MPGLFRKNNFNIFYIFVSGCNEYIEALNYGGNIFHWVQIGSSWQRDPGECRDILYLQWLGLNALHKLWKLDLNKYCKEGRLRSVLQ